MHWIAEMTSEKGGLRPARRPRSSRLVALVMVALGPVATVYAGSSFPFSAATIASTAHAQSADATKLQLRAKIKSAAEKLNDIASTGPDMIRAMFAGNTPSAKLLTLDEQSIAAQGQLEG